MPRDKAVGNCVTCTEFAELQNGAKLSDMVQKMHHPTHSSMHGVSVFYGEEEEIMNKQNAFSHHRQQS